MNRYLAQHNQAIEALSDVALDGLFSTADAVQSGVAAGTLRGLVKKNRCFVVAHGVYSLTPIAGSSALAATARARLARHDAEATVAHVTAARLHNLRTPYESQHDDDRVWILRAPDLASPTHRHGLAVLPAKYEDQHVTTIDGLRITTVARTAMDLARACRLERALVPLDHALSRGVPRGALVELAVYMKGWPGSAVFKPALELASPMSESGLESMARGLIHLDGIAAPELQAELRGESGKRYRVDMLWRASRVILEVDGGLKYEEGSRSLFDEKRREDDLRRANWNVIRWTYQDMFEGDCPATTWLRRALRDPSFNTP